MDKQGQININVKGSIFVALALFSAIMIIAGLLIAEYLDHDLGIKISGLGGIILLFLLLIALVTLIFPQQQQ